MMSYPHISMHFNGNAHCGKDREKNPVYCRQPYLDRHKSPKCSNIHNILAIILLVYAVLLYILAWVDRFSIILT